MRAFVNLYIILFLIDGIVSLVDIMTGRLLGIQPLSVFQGILAIVVLVVSLLLYLLIGCMRGFPKRVVLILVLFTVWGGLFFALPLPIYIGFSNTLLFLSIVQFWLGCVILVVLRYSGENGEWLHSRSDFEQLTFRWKRLFGFVAVNVAFVIPLVVVYLVVSLSLATSHLSRGFIHLGVSGISVEARTYLYEGKNIFLLPTVHIAQPSFYKKLVEPLSIENTLVIPEGVTDKHNVLKKSLDYSNLARSMGLEAQNNQSIIAGRSTEFCDVDISDFSPGTVDFIRTYISISETWASGNRMLAVQQYLAVSDTDLGLFWKDLVNFRNSRVITCITEHMQTYEYIVIPWGAMHMPGIERTIMSWDATVVERRRIPVWDWLSQEQKGIKKFF